MSTLNGKDEWKKAEDERRLSPAEAERKEKFDRYRERMDRAGYEYVDLTVGLVYANIMAIVLSAPFFLAFGVLFAKSRRTASSAGPLSMTGVFLAYLVRIPVHELIHGVAWSFFSPNGWRDISFGFIKKYMTPYCTCSQALKKGPYFFGALAPLFVLGIVPAVISVFTGSFPLLIFALLMIMSAGGDMTIVGKILSGGPKGGDVRYLDHPYQAGCVAFVKRGEEYDD